MTFHQNKTNQMLKKNIHIPKNVTIQSQQSTYIPLQNKNQNNLRNNFNNNLNKMFGAFSKRNHISNTQSKIKPYSISTDNHNEKGPFQHTEKTQNTTQKLSNQPFVPKQPIKPPQFQNQMQGVYNQIAAQKRELLRKQEQDKNLIKNEHQNTNNTPKNLPDGVRYEPIDSATLNDLKNIMPKNSSIQQKSNNIKDLNIDIKPSTNIIPVENAIDESKEVVSDDTANLFKETLSKELNKTYSIDIQNLIQYERNSNIFYSYLSNIAPNNEYTEILNQISTSNIERKNIYTDIYLKTNKDVFKPKDIEISNNVSFKDGVIEAIKEESLCLKKINILSNKINDTQVYKLLNNIIIEKICELNLLHLMYK